MLYEIYISYNTRCASRTLTYYSLRKKEAEIVLFRAGLSRVSVHILSLNVTNGTVVGLKRMSIFAA